jgi:bifunctional non-homologous end joining protein LigD
MAGIMSNMGLEEYKRKRRFNETPEPEGKVKKVVGSSFVIQKHRATRLHYDFRLEMEGVLRSWAIPKGPSFDPSIKRLAVMTEDHPMDYGGFEGVIPKGNYGAGKVIVWDNGTYEMVDPETPEKGWQKKKFHFILKGKKLKGEWVLVRGSRSPNEWIFFKVRDQYATAEGDVTEDRPESILSGNLVEEVGESSSKRKRPRETRHWFTPVESELERLGVKAAARTSMPKDVQPMLATLSDKPFDSPKWLFELKMDGMRALVFKDGEKLEMKTRNERALVGRFPTLADALKQLPTDSAIIDGEIVALDEKGHSHFELIQPRIHLSRARDIAEADERIPVYFYAFDLLFVNGFDLRGLPLESRKAVLRKLVPADSGWIRYNDHIEERGKDFFNAVSKHKLEGIVAKHRESPYQQTRSKYWLKIKTQHTDHFVVAGFTPPEGSRKHFGALVLGLYDRKGDLIHVGRAGGGFDDKTLKEVWNAMKPLVVSKTALKEVPAEIRKSTWVKPKLVCEVRFGEWTSAKQLRAPIFQGLRDDVDAKDCTLEESVPPKETKKATPATGIVTRVELTNQDKIYWPEDGFTKGDLIRYYDRISPYLVPHLLDRPLVFDRYPDGIHGDHFYQKDAHDYTPDWIRTQEIWSSDTKRFIRYFIGSDRDQLLYIANMGAIFQNPWSSRVQSIEQPDYVIFDLDPVDAPYAAVQEVAIVLKGILDELHLRAYPKTSGASGIHVYLPILENRFTYEDVRVFAEAVARVVVQQLPEIATVERVVRKRKVGEVYIDFLQNVKGKTVASVYSPRAVLGACVSTPLKWDEFKKPLNPRDYTIETVFDRIKKYGDLFAPVLEDRQDISGFLKVLKK